MPVDPEEANLTLEQNTGEWYSETGSVPEIIKSEGVEALHKRLGNIPLVSKLAEEVRALLPIDSILLKKILYEGAHSGDLIEVGRIGSLKQDIATLKLRSSALSRDLISFLDALDELIAASEGNQNPIVFV
jgi:hypothetical protein